MMLSPEDIKPDGVVLKTPPSVKEMLIYFPSTEST